MTYHDAYERLFAEKTGAHQYISFDPPDAIIAAEMLDARQIGGDPMDKTASIEKTKDLMLKRGISAPEALKEVYPTMSEKKRAEIAAMMGDEETSPEVVKAAGIYRPSERSDDQLKKDIKLTKRYLNPKATIKRRKREALVHAGIGALAGGLTQGTRGALVGGAAGAALGGTLTPMLQGERVGRRGALMRMKREAKKRNIDTEKLASAPAMAHVVKKHPKVKVNHAMQAAKSPQQRKDILKNLRKMKKEASMKRHETGSKQHDAYMKQTAQQVAKKHGLPMNQALVDKMHDIHFLHVAKGHNTPQTADSNFQHGIEQELAGTVMSPGSGRFTKKAAKEVSMPREFTPLNTFDLHIRKEASQPNWHNPTRELEETHRALRDSIKTVKADLYSAEQAEKMAMVEMIKQANAGLSAGFSMEQILHAGLSAVDVSSSFMAKEAHDLCSHIAQACASHQNSGLRKEAGMFMSPQQGMAKARENSKGWRKNPMKLLYNFDAHKKTASDFGQVNPNHPIPTKFSKLANSRIERKHLEVTLDELSRNLDYFNEQLRTL